MPHAPLLTADNLGLSLPDGRELFTGLSLSVAPGLTGLTGPNGTGKSLLVHVLAGLRSPTAGRVHRQGSVALLAQGHHLRPAASGETVAHRLNIHRRLHALERIVDGGTNREDWALVGDDGWDLAERALARLHRLGLGHLGLERSLVGLSGGELARLSLAAVLLPEPDLLILDEPTNDLDAGSVRRLMETLAGWSGSVLVVSHHRGLLRQADRILELTPNGLQEYGGSYDHYRAVRDAEEAAARTAVEQARAERRRARRDAAAARERQARRNARGARSRREGSQPKVVLNARREASQATTGRLARSRERSLKQAARRERQAQARMEERPVPRVDIASSGLPANRTVLRMEAVTWAPDAPAGEEAQPVVAGIDLLIRGPERVAVTGPNGAGKSTLLRLALGDLVPDRGTVAVGVPPGQVGFVDQGATLPPGRTLLEVLKTAHPSVGEERIRGTLARHLFPGDGAGLPVSALSGGERVRAALACALAGEQAPALLVLDEPTNHLDLESLQAVEAAVRDFDGALLVVSHDADFLAAVGVERELSLPGPSAQSRLSSTPSCRG